MSSSQEDDLETIALFKQSARSCTVTQVFVGFFCFLFMFNFRINFTDFILVLLLIILMIILQKTKNGYRALIDDVVSMRDLIDDVVSMKEKN